MPTKLNPRRGGRRRVIRVLAAILGLAALATGITACSGDSRSTVRFYLSKPEAIPYFRDLIAKYNESQSKIRVVFDTSSNLQAGFLRNNPPDLGLLNYNMEMSRFMARGALSDLSDMAAAKRIRPDVQKLVNQYAVYPGRTSVLPYSVQAASVIYNKRIFAENGIAVPETWNELIAACDKLRAAGVTPFYATWKDPWTVAQGWFDYTVGGSLDVNSFFQKMNKAGTAVGPDSSVSFEKNLRAPVDRMKMLAEKYTNKDAASRGYGDGNTAFGKGEAAMYMQGPWALGEIAKTAPKLSLGTFPLPMTENASDLKVRVNLDLAAWIPESAKNKEGARTFLAYLFQKKVQDDYNAAFLGYGTTTDGAPVTDPRIIGMKKYYDEGRFYQGASKAIPLTSPTENYMQAVVTGASVEGTLRTMDADWARLALRQ